MSMGEVVACTHLVPMAREQREVQALLVAGEAASSHGPGSARDRGGGPLPHLLLSADPARTHGRNSKNEGYAHHLITITGRDGRLPTMAQCMDSY